MSTIKYYTQRDDFDLICKILKKEKSYANIPKNVANLGAFNLFHINCLLKSY